jgi:hypothetical protein
MRDSCVIHAAALLLAQPLNVRSEVDVRCHVSLYAKTLYRNCWNARPSSMPWPQWPEPQGRSTRWRPAPRAFAHSPHGEPPRTRGTKNYPQRHRSRCRRIIREDRRECRHRLVNANDKARGRFVLAVHAKEDWWALAEAARRVAELLQGPIGKGAMLDVVASCEQLASNPQAGEGAARRPQRR